MKYLLVLSMLLFVGSASAQLLDNYASYQGVRLGTQISKYGHSQAQKTDDGLLYQITSVDGEATIVDIFVLTKEDGKIIAVVGHEPSLKNDFLVGRCKSMEAMYGAPSQTTSNSKIWVGKKHTLVMEYDDKTRTGMVYFTYSK